MRLLIVNRSLAATAWDMKEGVRGVGRDVENDLNLLARRGEIEGEEGKACRSQFVVKPAQVRYAVDWEALRLLVVRGFQRLFNVGIDGQPSGCIRKKTSASDGDQTEPRDGHSEKSMEFLHPSCSRKQSAAFHRIWLKYLLKAV
jgi:hypothetical protein